MSAADFILETTRNQRVAADPALSVFVSANAGSGKTRVLTNRVARLLLEGVDPSTILCITFTKAAAAEMADRLLALLGDWALADDGKLQRDLLALDGAERSRGAEELARARRLFARALETPGGLKIQTIHSFCEGVLKRFPLEAGVAPGFAVIDETQASAMAKDAVARVAAGADGAVADAFARLLARKKGGELRKLLERSTMSERRKYARAQEIGWPALEEEVARSLGVREGDRPETLAEALFAAMPRGALERAFRALDESGGNPQKYCAAPLRAFLDASAADLRLDALEKLFLDSKKSARAKFGAAQTKKIDPETEAILLDAQRRYLEAIDAVRAAEAFEDTRAFFLLAERCLDEFARMKEARAALDFDDLIVKSRALLKSDGGARWVLYKLDQGLRHILLDEAQDTGPDAWTVIEAPLDEFFSGAGAVETARTFFAVGDQKQSIYSFQGADAALFNKKEHDLGKKISAVATYKNMPLNASFRSAAPTLAFVDALFAPDEVVENVSAAKPLVHHCTRDGAAGLVEIWPRVPFEKGEKPTPWDAPLDAAPVKSRARALAKAVAEKIAGWQARKEMLASQGRPIEAGDVLVLVQTRGAGSKNALFIEVIRALAEAGVPVAGADKFKLTDDQGVLDLISYARAALYEGDDLSLAETLKSPFFNVDEESLYDLAANRATARLFPTLAARRDERADWRRAHEEFVAARAVALDEGPAAFFTHVLEAGAPSGWKRLAARLGRPSREPIEEFLRQAHEFELRRPRSLRLFLDAIEQSNAEVSREASEQGSSVRVMTVHKAKGLEANIVFLIDAHRRPYTKRSGDVLELIGPHGDAIPALALGDARRNAVLAEAADRKTRLARDEYRRLLYVAATRARDRLYICGVENGNEKDPRGKAAAEKSWHALAEDAFDRLAGVVVEAGEMFGGKIRRIETPQTASPKDERAHGGAAFDDGPLPDYLLSPAPKERRPRRMTPSQLAGEADAAPVFSPARGRDAYLRGRVLHRLLELLPGVDAGRRAGAADRLLARSAESFSDGERAQMRDEVMRVLSDPAFGAVFAPGSLAEVAIGGRPKGVADGVVLSGRIDRLAVLADRVLVVDYKTNRPPPQRVEDVPDAYFAQMAAYRGLLQEIYPGRQIDTALLWTFDARLMPLPDAALDRATRVTLA